MATTSISGTWTRLANSARLQRSSQCVSVIGPNVYIFGGELKPREPVDNQLDVVDLKAAGASATTLPAPSIAPTPRVGSTSARIGHDALYFFSGRGGLDMKPLEENGAVWRYTPSTSSWDLITPSSSGPFPAGRSYHAMTSDGNDNLYVHAGCPEAGRLADLWTFSVSKGTWTELAPAPAPARGGPSLAFAQGKLYRMNGFDGKTEQGGVVDVFDIQAGTWSESVKFEADGVAGPTPRSVCALLPVVVAGKQKLVTLFGEHDPSALGHAGAGKMLGDAWVFDVESSAWTKVTVAGAVADLPAPRGWFDADVVEGEDATIVVHGGLAEDNSRLGDVWKMQLSSS